MKEANITFTKIKKQSDIFLAFGVIGILFVMLIPMPPLFLDIFLTFNITLSLIILLVTLYTLRPLDFSVFPSLLLVATLFRLSLNVASTRLILLHGNEGEAAAGHVIKSFGRFVVGGNYVVGFVIFLILVVIQFVVITKGAGRIAEVAARFILDAMPGKQMSIDADLNAGLISDREARARRESISKEADFYGAMDGASKFVRGDSVASIIITLINLLGGFTIGVAQHKMGLVEAAQTYALLTVGDGLVTQIPAIIVSTSAGILVTRAASEANFGQDLTSQILFHPRAIAIAGSVLFILSLVPGLPKLPFFFLAAITGGIAYTMQKTARKGKKEETEGKEEATAAEATGEVEKFPELDLLELEVGHGLIPLVDAKFGGELLGRIKLIRRQCAMELGFIVPPIRIRDNIQLKSGGYSIIIRGAEVAKGEIWVNYYLAMNSEGSSVPLDGVEVKEPVFSLPAFWITESEKEKAIMAGYTVVDAPTIIATHLTEVIKAHAFELLGRQEVKEMLDNLRQTHPAVVDDLVPTILPTGGVQKVLQNLLREHVPIRDLVTILETLADWGTTMKDIQLLTEYVRQALARTLCKPYITKDGEIIVFTLHPQIEETISEAIKPSEQGTATALQPQITQKIINAIVTAINESVEPVPQMIILCQGKIRYHLKRLTERLLPNLTVLSYNEIAENVNIRAVGTVVW